MKIAVLIKTEKQCFLIISKLIISFNTEQLVLTEYFVHHPFILFQRDNPITVCVYVVHDIIQLILSGIYSEGLHADHQLFSTDFAIAVGVQFTRFYDSG